MELKVLIIVIAFVVALNGMKVEERKQIKPQISPVLMQNLKNEFAFSSFRNDLKYKYYNMVKAAEQARSKHHKSKGARSRQTA